MTRQRFCTTTAVVTAIVILGVVGAATAQQKVPPPIEQRTAGAPPTLPMSRVGQEQMTPEQRERMEQMQGEEKLSWSEFVGEWLSPRPVPKSSVVMIDERYGYPHIAVSFKMEVVPTPDGEVDDPEVVWMRGIPPEDPESPLHKMWQDRQAREIFYKMQQAWEAEHGENEYFVNFGDEIVPAPFVDLMEFTPKMDELPTYGLWQMNFEIADMNEDGKIDLLLPPMRKGAAKPSIFLGDGAGDFVYWEDTTWAESVPMDYGGIDSGDFNGDGHRDVVLAIHFKGQYVLFGDGKGNFSKAALLRSPDPRITSRAPAVADFDGDGRDDIALLAEIDYDLATNQRFDKGVTLWVCYTRDGNWDVSKERVVSGVIGDNLEASDVDGDGRVDLILGSNATNFRKLILHNEGDGTWTSANHYGILSNALHPDTSFAPSDSSVFAVFTQFLMVGDENHARTGVVRYTTEADRAGEHGEVIFHDDQRVDSFFRLGAGDLNGDGLVDVVAARKGGAMEVYVQMEGGQFYKEMSPELDTERGTPFDIRIVDVNGDAKGDILASFADKDGRKGGLRLWLSGTTK